MNLYGFKKYAFEDIRTCGLSTPIVSGVDSTTGTSVTYCVLPANYEIDGENVKTIPAGSIVTLELTPGEDDAHDNKVEIKYLEAIGENVLANYAIGNKIEDVKETVHVLLAEDYTIGDRKLVYYVVENTSNVEVR